MNILYVPGLKSTGYPNTSRSSELAPLLKQLADQHHGHFETLALMEICYFSLMRTRLSRMLETGPELTRGTYTAVASSFGAWLLLDVLSRNLWFRPPFRHIVLVNPFVEARSFYNALPPVVREVPRYVGYWRKGGNGVKGFWVGPSLVRDMLAPEQNLYDGRLHNLASSSQRITIVQFGSGGYGPPNTAMRLASALGRDLRGIITLPALSPDLPTIGKILA